MGLKLVLSTILVNGAQPLFGARVKAGCGGASMQTQCSTSSMPHRLLPTVKVMQYVPGCVNWTEIALLPFVHWFGRTLPLSAPMPAGATNPEFGEIVQTRKGCEQFAPPTPRLVFVNVTVELVHAVSAVCVKEACGVSVM